jgi:hypothetical protein
MFSLKIYPITYDSIQVYEICYIVMWTYFPLTLIRILA